MTLSERVNKILSQVKTTYIDLTTTANFFLYSSLSTIPFFDLSASLQCHAKKEFDAREYDLRIVHTPSFCDSGYCKEYDDYNNFKVYLDAPTGICLLYKDKPQAVISFKKSGKSTLFIPQIQGVRQRRQGGIQLNNSWGIEPFDWPALLVRIAEVFAQRCGFRTLCIQSAHNNNWKGGAVRLERMVRYYDNTAKRLGFEQHEDKNWYKSSI